MKIRLSILLLAFMLLASCGHKEVVIAPANILTQEQMASVLVDFHLAEAAIIEVQRNKRDVNYYTGHYYTSVLKKHNITRKKFSDSVHFYSRHIDELKFIYEEVLTQLSTKQSELLSVKSL
ncbi:MAG: DUF4296 domain-containing protein [Bacteroidota bacterium]